MIGPTGNKRAFPRYGIELRALVQGEGRPPYECVARDFCRSGLFLAYTTAPDPSPAAGQVVSVQLSTRGGTRRRFSLRVQIARVLEQGMGVTFAEAEEPLLEFLMEEVRRRTLAEAAPPIEPFPHDEARRAALIRECRERIEASLNGLMQRFVEESVARFLADELGPALNTNSFAVQQQLRAMRDGLGPRLMTAVLDGFTTAGAEALKGPDGRSGQWSLVEDQQLQDWIAVSAFVSRVEGARELVLFELQHRLGVVLGRGFGRETNPIGPHQIGQQFQTQLSASGLDKGLHASVFKVFEAVAAEALGDLYSELNGFLQGEGIVPNVKKLYHVIKSDTVRARRPPPGGGGGWGGTGGGWAAVGRELALYGRAGGLAGDAAGGPAVAGAAPFSLGELEQALERLRQQGFSMGLSQGRAPALADALTRAIPAADGASRRMEGALMESLDTLEALLMALQRDALLEEPIKRWIDRAELAIARAALRDEGIAQDPGHAFYTLVDILGQLFLWTPPEQAELRQRWLDQAERALAELAEGPGALEALIASLEQELEQRSRAMRARLDEMQAACHAHPSPRQRLLAMLDDVDQLFELAPERKVPAVLLELFDAGWKNLLWKDYARHGADGAPYRSRRAIIEQLLLRLCGSPDAAAQPKDEHLVEVVRKALIKTGGEKTAETVAEHLSAGLALARSAPAQLPQQRRDSVRAQALEGWERERRAECPAGVAAPAWRERLRCAASLAEGSWVVFRDGPAGRRRQLLCREEAGRLVFADGLEEEPLELTLAEVARRMAAGTLEPAPEVSGPLHERLALGLMAVFHQRLLEQLFRDRLTGLPERRAFIQALSAAAEPYVLLQLDVDRFESINHACGREGGDTLLVEVAKVLRRELGEEAVLARLDGDSFAALLPGMAAEAVRERVQKAQQAARVLRIACEGREIRPTFSIGWLDSGRATGLDAAARLTLAGAACQLAKDEGRDRIFEAEDDLRVHRQLELLDWVGEGEALDTERLQLQAVKRVSLKYVHERPHFELMVIAREDGVGLVEPPRLLRSVERFGRREALDRWLLEQTLDWVAGHRRAMEDIGSISLDLSAKALYAPALLEMLAGHAVAKSGLSAQVCLQFELACLCAGPRYTTAALRRLRKAGYRIGVRGFGSGAVDACCLKQLAPDYLRLDPQLLAGLHDEAVGTAVVRACIEMAQHLGGRTIGPEVESDALMDQLAQLGVDYVQGGAVAAPAGLHALG